MYMRERTCICELRRWILEGIISSIKYIYKLSKIKCRKLDSTHPWRWVPFLVIAQYTHHAAYYHPFLTTHQSNGLFKWLTRRWTCSSERLSLTNHFSTQLINLYGFLSRYSWNIVLTVTIRKCSQVQWQYYASCY